MADQTPLKIENGIVSQFGPTDTVPVANLPPMGAVASNVIATPTTIAADTSFIVLEYLKIEAALDVVGNVGVL